MLDFEDVVDSRDIIERIIELRQDREDCAEAKETFQDQEELTFLLAMQDEADTSPDWVHGEAVISAEYFTDYIKTMIEDCYELPEEFDTGRWPFNHMKMDWEDAAEEAKKDYIEFNVDGYEFFIRG